MKKVKMILTGGTIASKATDLGIAPNNVSYNNVLIEKYRRDHPNASVLFETEPLLNKLSENMELSDWEKILYCLKEVSPKKHDGIIITHGTDTLGFFANMLSVYSNKLPPVYIVSSDKVLSDPSSNGYENFSAALDMIKLNAHKSGVFVPYKNSDGKMTVHQGYQITQSEILSNDFFSIPCALPCYDDLETFSGFKNRVLIIESYVGMDYSHYDTSCLDAVLIRLYHGGTSNEKRLSEFIKKCGDKNIPVFMASVMSEAAQEQYASCVSLIKAGAAAVYNRTLETVYARLLTNLSKEF